MTDRGAVDRAVPGGRWLAVLALSTVLLRAMPARSQMVPLDPHPEAGRWVLGASFLSIDHEVVNDHNLFGVRIGYELNSRMDVNGIAAVPTEDTRAIEEGLLAVSFGHDVRPYSHDGPGAFSIGYEVGVLGCDPGSAVVATHAHLKGSLRTWGTSERNVTLGYRMGGWWVGREGRGPVGDLDYQWSGAVHLHPVTFVVDYQPSGNAAFSDSPFIAATLAWSPGPRAASDAPSGAVPPRTDRAARPGPGTWRVQRPGGSRH